MELFDPMFELMNEEGYLTLLKHVLENGSHRDDRTGVGTRSIFGGQLKFDLTNDKFPLLTTKKMVYRSIAIELIWFLSGNTNAKYLQRHNVKIWNEWATAEKCAKFNRSEGDLGPIYGHQWRNFGGKVDQITNVMNSIRTNPNSRRHIVTAWDPTTVDQVELPPCHTLFQFYVDNGQLSCHLYQRSGDIFLGVPFNIASYSLLTHMMASTLGLKPGYFIHSFGDLHLYDNHVKQATIQLSRDPYPAPTINLVHHDNIFNYRYEDMTVSGYQYHPYLYAAVAI